MLKFSYHTYLVTFQNSSEKYIFQKHSDLVKFLRENNYLIVYKLLALNKKLKFVRADKKFFVSSCSFDTDSYLFLTSHPFFKQ